jgi:hypothetical protein
MSLNMNNTELTHQDASQHDGATCGVTRWFQHPTPEARLPLTCTPLVSRWCRGVVKGVAEGHAQ